MRDKAHPDCVKTLNGSLIITEALHTDVTLGGQVFDNLFVNNGDERTVLYNITEIKGKAATAAVVRIFKPAGYLIQFDATQSTYVDNSVPTTPVTYILDNAKWLLLNTTASYVEYARTGTGGNNTINCNEQIRISFTLKRNTLNKSKFNLNTQFRPAISELLLTNNTSSIVFIGE